MNLFKGNINFCNEILDNTESKEDLKNNDMLVDLIKAQKEMQPKLFELIQVTENEDIMAILLLVNEDLQKTFDRYNAIKDGKIAQPFVPGEASQRLAYFNPNHSYGVQKVLAKKNSTPSAKNQPDLFDVLAGP